MDKEHDTDLLQNIVLSVKDLIEPTKDMLKQYLTNVGLTNEGFN